MRSLFQTRQLVTMVLSGLLFVTFFSTPATAGRIKSFTADHVTITPGGQEVNGRVYFTPDKIRMEQDLPTMPSGGMIFIFWKKEKKMMMLNDKKKIYFEIIVDESRWPGVLEPEKEKEKKKIGREKVSGFDCTKYAVVKEIDIMGQKRTMKVTTWEADELAFPIRTRTDEGGTQELRNIKEGQPPAEFFRIPEGYRKVDNMMEIMIP